MARSLSEVRRVSREEYVRRTSNCEMPEGISQRSTNLTPEKCQTCAESQNAAFFIRIYVAKQ